MADGVIVFSTQLDNKELERQLQKINKDISKLKSNLLDEQGKKSSLVRQAEELAVKINRARAEVEKFKKTWHSGTGPVNQSEQIAVKAVSKLEVQYSGVSNEVKKYDERIGEIVKELMKQEEKAGDVAKALGEADAAANKMGTSVQRGDKAADSFAARLKAVAKNMAVNIVTQSLAKLWEWMSKVVGTNKEAGDAIARLRGALLTIVQPLVGIIIPAFVAFINVLTKIASMAAQLTAGLFGGTIDQSKEAAQALYQQTDAVKGTGEAAKKAKGQLAAFDELNVLSEENTGADSKTAAAPDFSFESDMPEEQLQNILQMIEGVGAAILAWKFSPDLETGIIRFLGWLSMIDGGIRLVQSVFDAWQGGLNWDNLKNMLVGATELIAGLLAVFGPTAAAVGLITVGVLNLITAFHDMIENGMSWENTLLAISGLLAGGLGISLLTGSFIPVLIAGIASAILALVQWTGQGGEFVEAMKMIFGGFLDFFQALVSGDFTAAGEALKQIWEGLKAAGSAIFEALMDALANLVRWVGDKIAELAGAVKGKILEWRQAWSDFWSWIGEKLAGAVTWIQETLAGIALWIGEKVSGFIQGILLKAEEFGTKLKNALLEIWEGVKQGIKDFVNGGITMIENFINFIIGGINGLINKLNTVSASFKNPFSGETVTIGFHLNPIGKVQIPRLAAGAVIPPNREFMAILGDQRSGNNLEAPESLLRAIVREESGGAAIVPELREILAAIREGKVLMVDSRVLGKTVGESLASAARAGGALRVPVR